jgi:hypothetical protein
MNQNDTINRTDVEVLWQAFRRELNIPTGVLAWISIILNIFAIATFLKIRKSKGKLPQGAMQLLILAISEVAASVFWALGLVYSFFIEKAFSSRNGNLVWVLFFYGSFFCSTTSCMLTLFTAASRVYVMWRWIP